MKKGLFTFIWLLLFYEVQAQSDIGFKLGNLNTTLLYFKSQKIKELSISNIGSEKRGFSTSFIYEETLKNNQFTGFEIEWFRYQFDLDWFYSISSPGGVSSHSFAGDYHLNFVNLHINYRKAYKLNRTVSLGYVLNPVVSFTIAENSENINWKIITDTLITSEGNKLVQTRNIEEKDSKKRTRDFSKVNFGIRLGAQIDFKLSEKYKLFVLYSSSVNLFNDVKRMKLINYRFNNQLSLGLIYSISKSLRVKEIFKAAE